MKKCNKCLIVQDENQFSTDNNKKDKLRTICKNCGKEAYYDQEKTKEWVIKKIYLRQVLSSKSRKDPLPIYTKKEFTEWMTNNKLFDTIYNIWKESDYQKKLIPSVDRINDYKGYSFDNIQLMTWQENKNKYHNDAKNGINRKICKSINQYEYSGKFIQTFYSAAEAKMILNIKNLHISQACSDKSITAHGYQWRYNTGDFSNIKKIISKNAPIDQYDINNNFIQTFDNATKASKELNIGKCHIRSVCNGKRNTTGGFKWKYH